MDEKYRALAEDIPGDNEEGRKKLELSLIESEARYRDLFENANDMMLIGSREGYVLDVNNATIRALGCTTKDEVIGTHFSRWYTQESLKVAQNNQRKYIAGEPVKQPQILEFIRKDGEHRWAEVRSRVIKEGNKAVAIHAIARDITEKRELELKLKETNEKLRVYNEELELRVQERTAELVAANRILQDEINERKRAEEKIIEQAAFLDNAHDAIIVQDMEYRIIYWNKGAQYLYGWTSQKAIGKNANELLYKEASSELIEASKRVIEKGEWTGQLHQITRDGKEIIVESRWALMHDSEGRSKSILIINTDITEKKKLEMQFLRAQRMESIGTLAAGIAHDLNNILTPILLSLQLLQEKIADEESQGLIDILEKNIKRGASLIEQVQSFARGVEGEYVTPQIINLMDVIDETRQIVKETFPRSIEIRTDIQNDLWTVSGNATQLHQVLMNLCVNARDAMPDGGIMSISARNSFIDEYYTCIHIDARIGPYMIITVSDTGVGISPEIIDRIFEPFFTTKKPGKGNGLGLSTVYAITKSHGGFIDVHSEVGRGTIFKIYLPAIETTGMQKIQEPQYKLPAGHGELILVVDDEEPIRKSTRAILETHGYRAVAASNGFEAATLYAQKREEIRAVIMDMMMPVMGGQASIIELCKINPDIRVIAVSGLTENERFIEIGSTVRAFLLKPYTAEKLLKAIYEALI